MLIYKTTNKVNGKVYVGQQTHDNPDYLGSGLLICRAIKKYGIENFEKQILEHCATRKLLNEREKYWIANLGTIAPYGYNICKGGNGGDIFTNHPEKEKIRKDMSIRNIGKGNPMFGKNHSTKTRQQISKNKKGQRAGIPTWSAGKSWDEIKSHYSKNPYWLCLIEGTKKPSCKTYKLIDPNNNEFIVTTGLKEFCEEHKLPFITLRRFINKGIVPPQSKQGGWSQQRDNLTGWQIIL